MDEETMKGMLESTRRRPKVLFTDTHILEQETLDKTENVHEVNGVKVVSSVYVVRETRRTVTIREFDPEKSYGDAIQEFMESE